MLTGWGWLGREEPLPDELREAIKRHVRHEMRRYFLDIKESLRDKDSLDYSDNYIAEIVYDLLRFALQDALEEITLKPNWVPMKKGERDE